MKKEILFCGLCYLFLILQINAAEYFVGKQGNDANSGGSKDQAFLTIQKGVNALKRHSTRASDTTSDSKRSPKRRSIQSIPLYARLPEHLGRGCDSIRGGHQFHEDNLLS